MMMAKIKNKLTKTWKKHLLPVLKDPLFLSKWVISDHIRGVESGRTTVWVNGGYKTPAGDYKGELFMFLRDMHQGIMPYSRVRDDSYSAKLSPNNPDLEQVITQALSERGTRHQLREGVEDFIRRATQSLFFYTETFYELSCERDAEGNITKIELYFQIIPWSAAKHGRIKAGIHRVPKEKILHIAFPKELGGKRGLRKILKRLASISNTVIPDFQMEAMGKNENSGFNLERYTKGKYIEIAQRTRRLGWNQRRTQDNEILEYYMVHRHLRFADSQARLREHILKKVNQALNGAVINAEVEIIVENLLSIEDVKSEVELLGKGDLKFVEQIKRTTTH
jgi:hypothetical protein